MIDIKSENELKLISEAGKIVKLILEELKYGVRPGVTTADLEKKAAEIIKKNNARSAFQGYRGFPGVICTSLNEQVVHGIPGDVTLAPGDILSIDVGIEKNGYYADSAITVPVGDRVSERARALVEITEKALYSGIEKAVEGNRLFDISNAIQKFAESHGYGVVRGFVGHGIGKNLHESPYIPCFTEGLRIETPKIVPGAAIAVEVMYVAGSPNLVKENDGWTIATQDGKIAGLFEDTIIVTEKGYEIIT